MNIERIIVHHSASHPDSTTRELIEAWHKERGFRCIGYHGVIECGGEMRPGRPFNQQGAHCLGWNDRALGICVTGDNTREGYEWREAQTDALVREIEKLRWLYGNIPVSRHCDLSSGTVCPGISEEAWDDLRARWGDAEGG